MIGKFPNHITQEKVTVMIIQILAEMCEQYLLQTLEGETQEDGHNDETDE